MKKSIIKITTVLMLGVVVLTSCHKTVTKRKLDGEWALTSGTSTDSETQNGVVNTSTTTFTETKATTVSDGDISVSDMTQTFTFDKKAGTYKIVTVLTETESNEVTYYDQEDYFPAGTMDQKDVSVSTSTETGTFTITGGTGEIEKNTQIVLLSTGTTTVTNHTYTYFEEGTSTSVSPTGKYIAPMSSTQYSTSKTSTSTSTETNVSGTVITVKSLKKGAMEIEMNESSTWTSGSTTTSSSTNSSFTLTEKK